VLFQLPSFTDNIAGTSTGTISEESGTVTASAGTKTNIVRLCRVPTE
jgi:hypothetical protein